MDLRQINPDLAVSPQILPEDVRALAEAGFKVLINNRPDGEAPGQPTSQALEAEARRCGIDYRYIPVVPGEASDSDARAFAEALEQSHGPAVAFCRTGARAAGLHKAALGRC